VEFGAGVPKSPADNGRVTYGAFTRGLEIRGGGPSIDQRLTTIVGELELLNEQPLDSKLAVQGNVNVRGTVQAQSLTAPAPDNRVVNVSRVADMSEVLGNVKIVTGRIPANGDAAGIWVDTNKWSLTRTNDAFVVTFNPPFASTPIVTASGKAPRGGNTPTTVTFDEVYPDRVQLTVWRGNDHGTADIAFIAIGARP